MEELKLVTVYFDDLATQVPETLTILEAARKVGYDIPTLCHFKDLLETGACRVCLVEIEGQRSLSTSCNTKVKDQMRVHINTAKVLKARKQSVELILSNHPQECYSCRANQKCELQNVAATVGIRDIRFEGETPKPRIDRLSPAIRLNTNLCILCGRCIAKCKQVGVNILTTKNKGFETVIGLTTDSTIAESPCIYCGQCVNVCPTGAMYVHEETHRIINAMMTGKKVFIQVAPAVRTALGEEFGMPIGTNVTGKMVTALKRMGFYKVYDTSIGADLTVMEESHELIERLKKSARGEPTLLPMMTSCCPSWVKFAEYSLGDKLNSLSSCKSPQQMLGSMVKNYYAPKNGIDPADVFVATVMPCSSKKYEKTRPEANTTGYPDVDCVITTRELADFIKASAIHFASLPDSSFDTDLLGQHSSAGTLFGVTGGVTEAAVRTLYAQLKGEDFGRLVFEPVRGLEGVKEANLIIPSVTLTDDTMPIDLELRIAVVHTMTNAKPLIEQIKAGKSPYHFIEVMACPGGCINGGGQPFLKPGLLSFDDKQQSLSELVSRRMKVLYDTDAKSVIRNSHSNPMIQRIYSSFFTHAGSELAHHLLHTTYTQQIPFVRK